MANRKKTTKEELCPIKTCSIVEIGPTPRGSIFNLCTASLLDYSQIQKLEMLILSTIGPHTCPVLSCIFLYFPILTLTPIALTRAYVVFNSRPTALNSA